MDALQQDPLLVPQIKFYKVIEACFESANASWICADACLHEVEHVALKECIDLCLRAAEVCTATARTLVRHENMPFSDTIKQLKACIEACNAMENECKIYAGEHEHCLISSRAAHDCLRACVKCLQELEGV